MNKQFIDGKQFGAVHQLPRVELLGKWWWIDESLQEFRSVDPPLECVSFREMDDKLDEEALLEQDC